MKEIDEMLEQWIYNSVVRAEVREAIIKMQDKAISEAYNDGMFAGENGFDKWDVE